MVHRDDRRIHGDGACDVDQAVQGHVRQVARLAHRQAAEVGVVGVVGCHRAGKAAGGLNRHSARACEANRCRCCVVREHHATCSARACGTGVAVHACEAEYVATKLVKLTCAIDGVGHRHCGVVVEVERGACTDAHGVGTQRSQGVSAIAHI